jgi:hypothetical protein
MAFSRKNASELRTQEAAIHRALRSWYITPGIQGELRNKENEAVQTVLEVLVRRRATLKVTRVGSTLSRRVAR